MEHEQWMLDQIEELENNSKDYRQIALYQAFADLIKEQYKRIAETQGEIDGLMWSPKKWG